MSLLAFSSYALNGVDAQKFLQGQVTVDTERLAENETRYTAICDLRPHPFWLMAKKNNAESFDIIVTQDQAEEFAKHIKNMVLFQK